MNGSRQSTEEGQISDELELLTQRVERLERSNRLLKIVNLLVAVAVIAITRIPNTSAGASGVINALQYNLFSRSGNLMATFGPNKGGFPSITFFDAAGKRLAEVGQADNGKGAGLYAYDGNGVLPGTGILRASFSINSRLSPTIDVPSGMFLFDAKGKDRVDVDQVTVPSFDGFFLGLRDGKGNIRAEMGQTDAPVPDPSGNITPVAMVLHDENGFARSYFVENKKFTPPTFAVGVNDATGKFLTDLFDSPSTSNWGLAVADPTGAGGAFVTDGPTFGPIVALNGDNEMARAIMARDPNPGIGVEDASGKPRAFVFVDGAGDSGFTAHDVNGLPRANITVNPTATGFAVFQLLDTKQTQRGFLAEPLNGSNAGIGFNDATNNSIGSWSPPAAPIP